MEGIGKECFNDEAEFLRVMDGLPLLMRTCGADGQLVFCNSAWKKFAPGWGLAFNWSHGMHKEYLAGWEQVYSSNVALKRGFSAKYLSRGNDGNFFWLAEQLVPSFSFSGELIGYACYAQDVDKLVKAAAEPFKVDF